MKPPLMLISFLLILSCSKQTNFKPRLNSIEYKVINAGDANIKNVVLSAEVFDKTNKPNGGRSQTFFNLLPSDTATMVIEGDTHSEYIDNVRTFRLVIAYRNKVYSAIAASSNFIVEGEPYKTV